MAVQNPVGGHEETLEGSMDFNGIDGILRTGWYVTARGGCERGNGSTVKVNREQNDLYQYPP